MNIKEVAGNISKVKDIIYIITFVILLATFFVNEGKNRQKQDDLIEQVKEVSEISFTEIDITTSLEVDSVEVDSVEVDSVEVDSVEVDSVEV